MDHLIEKGFEDMRTDIKDRFKKIDRWMILLIGAVSSFIKKPSPG